MCGTRLLEDLQRQLPRRAGTPAPEPALADLHQAFAELRRRQQTFHITAGTHGAALAAMGPSGELTLLDTAEDVGRHNAADKLLGAQLRAGNWPLAQPALLLVSGRISYEIIHKGALAGVAAVAGVGMPTSLAVRAARAAGMRLLGFVRDGGALVYAPEPAAD
jgi:FdhD protein